MLQQTTAAVVANRFPGFMARFGTLSQLASAAESEVVQAWQGLGYYRRARSLHAGARHVLTQFGGSIPRDEATLLQIPGVGEYTASAIRALAFDEPAVAVDGNVARVLARFFAHEGDSTSARSRRRLAELMSPRVPNKRGAAFAESLIELGALVCRPPDPDCGNCPLRPECAGYAQGRARELPLRTARPSTLAVNSPRAFCEIGGRWLFVRRDSTSSLLPGFLEFPGRWGEPGSDPAELIREEMATYGLGLSGLGRVRAEAKHTITKHRIHAFLYEASLVEPTSHPRIEWHAPAALPMSELTTETRKLLSKLEVSRGS